MSFYRSGMAVLAIVFLLPGCESGGSGPDPIQASTVSQTIVNGEVITDSGSGVTSGIDNEPQQTAECVDSERFQGRATYYSATGVGHCSFEPLNDSMMIAAMNASDYGSADWCGACLEVSGPRGKVTVQVMDSCPECSSGDLDLSSSAFAQIADPVEGLVDIDWKMVPCAVNGGVSYHFKSGSSEWWAAVQLRNHRFPIARLEYQRLDGGYTELYRERYNYFIASAGMGPGPYSFRATDVLGQTIESRNIPLQNETDLAAGQQFPACPL